MSKSVNVDFVTRQIEVDTDGKEHFISAAMAAKDAEQSMLSAQNAANEVKEIYNEGNLTPLSDLLGGLGTKLKRWGSIFANKVFASNLPIVYNSVAEMKADTMLWEGMSTKTLGYYAPNDGGGASYLIRAKADTDVDDGGSLHELSNGLVAELIIENGTVNVKQFGAKGDGVTDDTEALQNAINTSMVTYLPANFVFKITSNITLHKSNTLYGEGKTSSIVCEKEEECKIVVTGNDEHTYRWRGKIEGINFQGVGIELGNTKNDYGAGYLINNCSFFDGAGAAISLKNNCWLTHISNVIIMNYDYGIFCYWDKNNGIVNSGANVTFDHVVFANGDIGLKIDGVCYDGYAINAINCDFEHANWSVYVTNGEGGNIQICNLHSETNLKGVIYNDGAIIWLSGGWCFTDSSTDMAQFYNLSGAIKIEKIRLSTLYRKTFKITGGHIYIDNTSCIMNNDVFAIENAISACTADSTYSPFFKAKVITFSKKISASATLFDVGIPKCPNTYCQNHYTQFNFYMPGGENVTLNFELIGGSEGFSITLNDNSLGSYVKVKCETKGNIVYLNVLQANYNTFTTIAKFEKAFSNSIQSSGAQLKVTSDKEYNISGHTVLAYNSPSVYNLQ